MANGGLDGRLGDDVAGHPVIGGHGLDEGVRISNGELDDQCAAGQRAGLEVESDATGGGEVSNGELEEDLRAGSGSGSGSGAGLEVGSDEQGGDGVWDMRDVVVVVPVARAGRRLLELLVQKSEERGGCKGNMPRSIAATNGELNGRLSDVARHPLTAGQGLDEGVSVSNGELDDECAVSQGSGLEDEDDGTGGGGGGLFPPRIVTVGQLPELFYEPKAGVADGLRSRLVRLSVLQEKGQRFVEVLKGRGGEVKDGDEMRIGGADWGVVQQLEKLSVDLAGGLLRVEQVLERCDELGIDLGGEGAAARWQAAGILEEMYHERLAEVGLVDRQRERLELIAACGSAYQGDLVLVGIADQNQMLNTMLHQVSADENREGRLSALVHCDEAHAEGFDEVGGLVSHYWADQEVVIGDEMLRFVERENETGGEVVRLLAEVGQSLKSNGKLDSGSSDIEEHPVTSGHGLEENVYVSNGGLDEKCAASQGPGLGDVDDATGGGGGLGFDAVTVGLCDEGMAGEVERAMGLAGVKGRYAGGKAMMWSGPVVLLGMLGRYADGKRWEDFAAVMRHVDMEIYVQGLDGDHESNQELGEVSRERMNGVLDGHLWRLDRYAMRCVPMSVEEVVREHGDEGGMVGVLKGILEGLLPGDVGGKQGVGEWAVEIGKMMGRVYEGRELKRYDRVDEPMYQCLKGLGGVLREMVGLGEDWEGMGEVSFSEAVVLVLGELKEAGVSPLGGERAVELMGVLDLQMDDARGLVLCGFNEGRLPASRNADAFLPDGLRKGLGLMDNGRRYARDVMLVNALIRSREVVRFVSARKSREGDPLMPSRLMLACGDEGIVRRVMGFYEEGKKRGDEVGLLKAGKTAHDFLIAKPWDGKTVEKMRVTGFRDYLACPYRFYLKHVEGLERMDDEVVELDGAGFGLLGHQVLELFGREVGIRDSANAVEVMGYLSDRLDEVVKAWYGKRMRATLRVQVAQLRERLNWFAGEQAKRVMQGWRICGDWVEWKHEMKVDVDGEAMRIVGKIDRIDVHETHGLCLIDYKTGDGGRKPEETHRRGGEWVDLQLPLYMDLVRDARLSGLEKGLSVGYMNLPRKLEETGFKAAVWDEQMLASARDVRDEVIRKVRGQVFWPPAERQGVRYEDGFERLCGDKVFDREELIERSWEVK
ncbi:PD-(D/E)XK nuclease family protein [Poriferisphaera corsica]|uniref:PD-(D/E)XK nuclease family protein n=1 Tax=Poriferisphaera corsica TaxID=2528020 RepID=UPI0011A53FD3|nr:PD-(D/E)XK nuclease family protein [Poriferisphaera corsica]